MSNLELWDQVQKTDPKHTKPITGKSYQGTSPKPHYLIHKATETFGPCGIGWGFNIVDERIEDGAGGERMSIARVKVWYEWGGKRGEVEHIGGTSFSGTRKNGTPFTDEDAPKKSVTDALIKALSMIGFAGDIFMGRYDDSKYVPELHQEAKEAARPSSQPEPQTPAPTPSQGRSKDDAALYARLSKANSECKTKAEFSKLWAHSSTISAYDFLTDEKQGALEREKTRKFAELEEKEPSDYRPPDFDNLPPETQDAVNGLRV